MYLNRGTNLFANTATTVRLIRNAWQMCHGIAAQYAVIIFQSGMENPVMGSSPIR